MVYKPTEETRRKGVAKRRRIIDVAHGLLSTGGFAAATVRRTADGAGISTGSVYSYFGSRDELLAELFRELASHEFAVVDQAVRAAEPAARQRLTALVETFAERLAETLRREFGIPWLRLTVRKPGAVAAAAAVGVQIERGARPEAS